MAAGSAALRFNSPLGVERVDEILARLEATGPRRIVDLGCGRGAFLVELVARLDGVTGIGVDNDPDVLKAAERAAGRRGVSDRVDLVRGDASAWQGRADTVVCVGSVHALGGVGQVFRSAAGRPGRARCSVRRGRLERRLGGPVDAVRVGRV